MLDFNLGRFDMRDEMYIILQSMEHQLARIACSLERVILIKPIDDEEDVEWEQTSLGGLLKRKTEETDG